MTDPTLERVRGALDEHVASGQPVTFTAIAERLGVSRATLYRRRELRELIDSYRSPSGELLTLTSLATHVDQLQHALEALADKVRRHEEELRRLKRPTR
jgi:AcrR family transcriptional regulator